MALSSSLFEPGLFSQSTGLFEPNGGLFKAGGGAAIPESWQIVGQYGETAFGSQNVNSGSERRFMTVPIDLAVACSKLRVVSHAFYVGGASGGLDTAIGGDLQVGHGWVYGGSSIKVDASRTSVPAGSGAVESSEVLASDASLTEFPAGARLWLNREVDHVAGGGSTVGYQSIPYATGTVPTGMGRKSLNLSTSELALTSHSSLANSGFCEMPRCTIGFGQHGYTFWVLGDSIAYHNTDANFGDGGESGFDGRTAEGGAWVRRAFMKASQELGYQIPFSMNARASATLQSCLSNGASRAGTFKYASVLFVQIGTNDLTGGRTYAQLKADAETLIANYKAAFSAANPTITPKAVVCTLLPRVAGHGGAGSGSADYISYNAAVRNKTIAGQDGYLDPNAAVASPTDETAWADINDEVDGTHPSAQGQEKIADYIKPTLKLATPWL